LVNLSFDHGYNKNTVVANVAEKDEWINWSSVDKVVVGNQVNIKYDKTPLKPWFPE
jgi:hypothetical protein